MRCLLLLLLSVLVIPAFAEQLPTDKGTLLVDISTDPETPKINDLTKLMIDFVNPNTNTIQEHIDYRVLVTKGDTTVFGPIPLTHTSIGSATIPVEFKEGGEHQITIDVEGILFQPIPKETVTFTMPIAAAQENGQPKNGGCLVATAAYGTELAPQVQLLREIRDGIILKTGSGITFMNAFNSIYYSFSPTVADWERQNPTVREAVRISLTPMLSTLSIFNYLEIDSESELLWYGIGVILLNVAMYFVAPVVLVMRFSRRR
jgi:hypothetical protein